ncbi:ASCH domain-containing protein [Modestobacter sp. VKM Ac-2986]|uniref:ASCH domain-containing protein n=1 Tax=Modestobacter sp. VKM Ac-2986 TaxID=3004140 RepID=UPI0022AAA37B|nr:ASCH domain-containing protein [Modestobacter sp. VKM Ac-2986]MCZ2829128.1 ASCH domain-containing protein [Modestobacter sp. VKM Ac-2986]
MSREPDEVSVADEELIAAATQVIDRNGDGQMHTVGAALRDERGVIHVGVNLFHFTGGPCAELVVLGAARAAGAREPRTIVAVGDAGRGVLSPCGRDRQVFADQHPDLRVIVPTEHGPVVVRAVDLLPHAYRVPAGPVQRLRFRAGHLDAVRDGSKRITMRFHDPVHVGPALLVFELDEEVQLPGRITSTVAKKVTAVTEQEARADGFLSSAHVLPLLRDYYPDLQPDDEIVIVQFEVD